MKRILAIILVISMVFAMASCKGKEGDDGNKTPAALPADVAAKSENFSFSLAEATYLFNKYYVEFQYQNANYLSFYGLDKTKSLKEQTYSGENTWFDYFLTQTKTYLNEILVFCEAAKAEGYQLDDKDKTYIDKVIESIEKQADGNGYTIEEMVGGLYGSIVNLDVMRSFFEKEQLAIKYYNHLLDSYDFTEQEEAAYLAEHTAEFYYVDYISFTLKESSDRDAKAHSEELKAVKGAEEFTAYVDNYEANVLKTGASSRSGPVKTSYVLNGEGDLKKWAFSANVGDVYTDYNDVDGVYTVYMLTATPSLQEYNVRNVRFISLTTSKNGSYADTLAKAKEVLETWKSGEATAQSFSTLAAEKSEDSQTKANGGVYPNVGKGDEVLPADALTWLFSDTTNIGDTEIFKGNEAYYIVFFDSEGRTQWRVAANNALGKAAYDADTGEMKTKYPVELKDDILTQIDE